jgi:signal transduction histidine kinase
MITIKGYDKFQHYKNRKPPWIKLYRDLLDNMEWRSLSDPAARLLVDLWLLASESNEYGVVEMSSNKLAWRLRLASNLLASVEASLKELQQAGFITIASNVLATCYQHAIPETETETETETEREKETECQQARELADRLRSLVQSQKRVKVDGRKVAQWAKCFNATAKMDGVDFDRQATAMDWYEVNAGGSYVPVIESGKAWREKFLKLEAAIERANDPFAVVTEPYRPTAASIAEAEAFEAEQRAKAEEAERSAAERKRMIEELHARHPEWRQ